MEGSPTTNSPPRLQDTSIKTGFPAHLKDLLGGEGGITFPEIFCRLVHVCMVEVGFVPVLDGHDCSVEELLEVGFRESSMRFVNDLKTIVDKSGSLHNVIYKVVAFEEEYITAPRPQPQERAESVAQIQDITEDGHALEKPSEVSLENSSSVLMIESNSGGDRAFDAESLDRVPTDIVKTRMRKVISDDISVCVVHDGYEMYVVGTGPEFHRNIQVSISKYIRSSSSHQIPTSAKADDYLLLVNFSAYQFVDDVKRKFCYPIMDEINGLSFDIRSLAYLPPEIIVEVAKRCSPLSIFRLRATCTAIRDALCCDNQQFWKAVLKRDFPYCNIANLSAEPPEERYFRKYSEMCLFTVRRPLRRTFGRIFPFYMLTNF